MVTKRTAAGPPFWFTSFVSRGSGAAAADAEEAATLKVGTVIYKLKKDENGKKVAAEAKDKKVEIKGKVEEKNGEKWIAVTSCKIVE